MSLKTFILILVAVGLLVYLITSRETLEMWRATLAERNFAKGIEALRERDMVRAGRHFDKAVRYSPKRHLMLQRLANIYTVFRAPAKALPYLRQAVEENPKNWEMRMRLGTVLMQVDSVDEAVQHLEKALEIGPKDSALLLNNVGYAYADKGIRLEEAVELLERAIKIEPNAGYIVDSLGWAYYRQGRLEEALELLERAHQLSRGRPEIPEILAHLWEVRQKIEERKRKSDH